MGVGRVGGSMSGLYASKHACSAVFKVPSFLLSAMIALLIDVSSMEVRLARGSGTGVSHGTQLSPLTITVHGILRFWLFASNMSSPPPFLRDMLNLYGTVRLNWAAVSKRNSEKRGVTLA